LSASAHSAFLAAGSYVFVVRADQRALELTRAFLHAEGTTLDPPSLLSVHRSVSHNRNPNGKLPGEKQPGKFHYNPGNMSGKTPAAGKPKSEQQKEVDQAGSDSLKQKGQSGAEQK